MVTKGFFPLPDPTAGSAQFVAPDNPAIDAFDATSVSIAPVPAPSRLALSELAPGVMQSEIRAMSVECERVGGINLAQGVCDTPVPAVVEEAAIAAIRAGHNIYTRLDGIARLRTAIADKQQRDYGLRYDQARSVINERQLSPRIGRRLVRGRNGFLDR